MNKEDIHEKLLNCSAETIITAEQFVCSYGNDNQHHQTKETKAEILARAYNLIVAYDEFLKIYKFTKR